MPVVIVVAPPHPAIEALLGSLADDLAGALDLGAGDVIATHVPAGASVVSGGAPGHWPLVSIHGSDRGRERMDAARAAASAAVHAWCGAEGLECEGVWTEWVTP